jgi:hypothetical protein
MVSDYTQQQDVVGIKNGWFLGLANMSLIVPRCRSRKPLFLEFPKSLAVFTRKHTLVSSELTPKKSRAYPTKMTVDRLPEEDGIKFVQKVERKGEG